MTSVILAIGTPDAPGIAMKVLAIFGGILLGGLLIGFIARVAVKLLTTRSLPLWGVRFMRLLGGVAGGWLVWLFVFGGGGSGLGGSGGFGFGGSGNSKDTPEEKKDKKPEVEKPPKKDDIKGNEKKNILRVAILGLDPLKKLQGKDDPDYRRCYLIEGETPQEVHDLEGIQKVIRERRKEEKDLKVIVVIYTDSPDKEGPLAKKLFNWLAPESMFLTWDLPPNKAPF